ncbi:MAG TPA: glycosyltransferase family 9 protein [Terriglobia bacterium]|nr:glycosyltransferase family 9 protein [Terriglobia bacterium]
MAAGSILPALPIGARILVVRLRSIGDIILLTPALRLLKEWRPDLLLSVMVEHRFHELLENNPDVDEIVAPDAGRGWGKIKSRWQTVRELRARHFSVCVNLHGGPTSAFIARWSGATCKVGFHHYRRRGKYHILVPDARMILGHADVHTAELQAAAFFHLGLPKSEVPRARIFVGSQHLDWWEKKRAEFGVSRNKEYALIHPTAMYATKQWAPEHFAQIGNYLEREKGLLPVYSCGPGESAVLDAVERASGSALRRLEGASLGEFAAALSGARLFVGNDSGPAHIAQALNRPTVVIFGSSSSVIWGPWPRSIPSMAQRQAIPQNISQVVQNSYECNPCPGDRCYRYEQPECILSIRYEQVQSAVNDVLMQSRLPAAGGN